MKTNASVSFTFVAALAVPLHLSAQLAPVSGDALEALFASQTIQIHESATPLDAPLLLAVANERGQWGSADIGLQGEKGVPVGVADLAKVDEGIAIAEGEPLLDAALLRRFVAGAGASSDLLVGVPSFQPTAVMQGRW